MSAENVRFRLNCIRKYSCNQKGNSLCVSLNTLVIETIKQMVNFIEVAGKLKAL